MALTSAILRLLCLCNGTFFSFACPSICFVIVLLEHPVKCELMLLLALTLNYTHCKILKLTWYTLPIACSSLIHMWYYCSYPASYLINVPVYLLFFCLNVCAIWTSKGTTIPLQMSKILQRNIKAMKSLLFLQNFKLTMFTSNICFKSKL